MLTKCEYFSNALGLGTGSKAGMLKHGRKSNKKQGNEILATFRFVLVVKN